MRSSNQRFRVKGFRRQWEYTKPVSPLILLVIMLLLAGCANREKDNSAKEEPAKSPFNEELAKVQGVWEGEDKNGQLLAFLVESDSVLVLPEGGSRVVFTVEVSPEKAPKQFKLIPRGTKDPKPGDVIRGIYELNGTSLKISMVSASAPLPTTFTDDVTFTFELKGKSANLAPADPNYVRGLVTWNYWKSLDSVVQNTRLPSEILKEAKTPDQIITAFREIAGEIEKMRSKITDLSVTNVDSEAAAYASLLTETFGKLGTAYSDLADIFVEYKEFRKYKGSDQVVGEAILRLLAGDPLGTYNDLNEQEREYMARIKRVLDRVKETMYSNDLDAQQLKVRSSLSEKYNREFQKQ